MNKPLNPYKKGTFAYQEYNTLVGWYGSRPRFLVDLAKESATYRRESENFCRYNWSMMQDWERKANVIDDIILANLPEN